MYSLLYSVFLAASLAQAAVTATMNGADVIVKLTRHSGEELVPVLSDLSSSTRAILDRRSSKSRLHVRDDTTNNIWCGVATYNPVNDGTQNFTQILSTWTIPEIALRSGQTVEQNPSIAQWIGIDGGALSTALIQGGTVSEWNSDGTQKNTAWYEFVPAGLIHIDNFGVNTGDTMSANLTVTSLNSGIFEIINNSQGTTMTINIDNGGGILAGYQAEWILEDLTSGGTVPMASFADNTMTNNIVVMKNGATVDPTSGQTIVLVQENNELCSVTMSGADINFTAS